MKFLVVNKKDDTVYALDLDEIIALKKTGKTIEYHTAGEVFEHITSLDSLTDYLKQFGFERLDRDNIVKLDKISSFDSGTNKVIFESDGDKPKKSFTVSWANVNKVIQWLQQSMNIKKD